MKPKHVSACSSMTLNPWVEGDYEQSSDVEVSTTDRIICGPLPKEALPTLGEYSVNSPAILTLTIGSIVP